MDHLTATVALNMLPKIGPVRVRRLLEKFGSSSAILSASASDLQGVSGIGAETASIISNWRDHADPEAEIADASARGIKIILPEDETFPPSLRELYDCPLLLYVWGELTPADWQAISIVGTRRCSQYGLQTTKRLAYQLASLRLSVVSGLARGIDTAAHEGAIAAKGRTIAVIGSGLAQVYPPENMALAQMIADGHGAVVTEFPLYTTPDKKTFPQRNRIVAGWSQDLLVVECPARSGSLITANLAAEAGKTVYAVPGPIDRPTSSGCHDLIRDGAILVTGASDIIEGRQQLPLGDPIANNEPRPEPVLDLNPEQRLIYDELSSRELSIDQLVKTSTLPVTTVMTTLMSLELKGLAKSLPGSVYVRL